MATIDVMLNLSAANPIDISDTTAAPGTATTASKADHIHAHGNRGGGTLHALVIAAGAAGFMDGADKTKLDGIAAGAQPDQDVVAGAGMTGGGALDPTTLDVIANADGSITVNPNDVQVGVLATDAQHGNLGGGSLHALAIASGAAGFLSGADKQSLDDLGTTFLRLDATNDPLTGTLATQAIVPDTTQTRDIGSASLLFRRFRGNLGAFVSASGTSTIALPANTARGGLLAGTQSGVGTNVHRLEGGAFPAVACVGNAATNNVLATATVESIKGGSVAFGSAYGYGSGTALVRASGYSSFTAGYAYGPGNSTLQATNSGSLAFGYANARSTGSTSTLESTGNGSFAAGFVRTFSGTATTMIRATAQGTFASGYVRAQSGGGAATLEATGQGAFAQGLSRSNSVASMIQATGQGSFAQGRAQDTSIIASGINSVQFGPGTNALDDSLQVGGAGLRFKGTANAPGTPQNGDFWRRSTFVEMRSDGVTWTFNQSAAFTRNATVVEDRTLLASASATVVNNNNVLAALIADLQTIGALG